MQLIILGMHRSGTSVVARLLNLMGAYFGPEGISTGANQENPKGFWERKDVRALNDFVLNSAGCDWDRVAGFDIGKLESNVVDEFLVRARKIVLEMDGHRPWFIKEPRLCLLLPLWLRVLEMPVCIHIYRSPVEVAGSLRTRNQIPIPVGLALWQEYVLAARRASESLPSVTVVHRDLMTSPPETVARLQRELEGLGVTGLRVPLAVEVQSFVDKKLYRERETNNDLHEFGDVTQVALFKALVAGKKPPAKFSKRNGSVQKLMIDYEASLPKLVTPQEKRRTDALRKSIEMERVRKLDKIPPLLAELKDALAQDCTKLRHMLDVKPEELAGRERIIRERAERIKTLAAENVDLKKALGARGQELAAQKRELAETRATLVTARDTADKDVKERFREIARLIEMLDEVERARDVQILKVDALEKRLVEQRKTSGVLEMQVRATRHLLDVERQVSEGMRSSLGWRIIAPARRGARLFGSAWRHGRVDASANEVGLVMASGLFDEAWYLKTNPDVAKSGMDPVAHYLKHGADDGRDPSREFSTKYYLATYPDIVREGINPLVHYILSGAAEGRRTVKGKDAS